jgi:hypothetical protein
MCMACGNVVWWCSVLFVVVLVMICCVDRSVFVSVCLWWCSVVV